VNNLAAPYKNNGAHFAEAGRQSSTSNPKRVSPRSLPPPSASGKTS